MHGVYVHVDTLAIVQVHPGRHVCMHFKSGMYMN